MRVADYIIDRLVTKYGIRTIPLLTGNGSLVINDAIAKSKDVTPVCVHHEQDAGYFALGHSKFTGKLSVVNPTTGCAGTNCITPLLAAYQDHVPILFLSGNVALKQTTYWQKRCLVRAKKIGAQEFDIVELVKPITKYAAMMTDWRHSKRELDKAVAIATDVPFGPVWLDVPADVGASEVVEDELEEWGGEGVEQPPDEIKWKERKRQIDAAMDTVKSAKRPLLLVGQGVQLSGSISLLNKFSDLFNIHVAATYGGINAMRYDNPLYLGVIGIKGSRAANFALQQCDVLLCLGCCLNSPQLGYAPEKFAAQAKRIVVDVDADEIVRRTGFEMPLRCDLKDFFEYVLK